MIASSGNHAVDVNARAIYRCCWAIKETAATNPRESLAALWSPEKSGSPPEIDGVQGPCGTVTDHSLVPYKSTQEQDGTIMGPVQHPSGEHVPPGLGRDNLFVVGAANFSQNVGYDPTGTVGELDYNTADAIIPRYLSLSGMLS